MHRAPRGGRVDLSSVDEVTTALLRDPLDWRFRVVEHLEFDNASTCLRRRSLQCGPLREVLPKQHVGQATSALISLYFASVPRGPLLDFDISGPGDSGAFLLPRADSAAQEMSLLRTFADEAGIDLDEGVEELLTELLAHSVTPDEISGDRPALAHPAEYLADGFDRPLPPEVIRSWSELDERATRVLARHTDDAVALIVTQHPILGLSALRDRALAAEDGWWEPVDVALRGYVDLLRIAAEYANTTTPARNLIDSIADYGQNYDMLAVVEVPLDEPFTIKYRERRDLGLRRGGRVTQDVVLSDARSNHVVLSVSDSSVSIVDVQAKYPNGETTFGAFTARSSDQLTAVYAHDPDRDYRALFGLRLVPLLRLRRTVDAATVLLVLVAVALGVEHPSRISDLAIIVGPTSLAASVLLIREPTTLSGRLRRGSFQRLAFALTVLLAVSVLSYLWPTLSSWFR